MTPLELLISKLTGAKKSGNGWSARCPAHEDRHASLSIAQGSDGTALVKCHAGCDTAAVLAAVGLELRDLFPSKPGPSPTRNGKVNGRAFATAKEAATELERQLGTRSAAWAYHDAGGAPVGVVVRWDTPEGKVIRPVSKHADGWRIEHMPKPRPLYALPKLLQAKPDERIWVVEGEKTAEAVWNLGLAATTTSGGSSAAKHSDWSPMHSRHVVVVPDNDEPGRRYAEEVANLCLQAGAASVRILDLAKHASELPKGGDLADVAESDNWYGLPLGDSAMLADLGELLQQLAAEVEPRQPSNSEDNGKADNASTHEGKNKRTVAEVLADIGTAFELWHDAKGVAYASLGRASVPIRSRAFRCRLTRDYRNLTGKVPNAEALGNAIAAIEAAAVYDSPIGTPCVRVAHHNGKTYVHLADERDTVIVVGPTGWEECEHPPVRFLRRPGMEALPMPTRGGSLDDLRQLLNCPEDDAWALLKAWMTATMAGIGPYPLLTLVGEQGSAKSTTARLLKALLDPSEAPLRCEPREIRDLMIAVRGQHLLALDNVSHLSPWLSDALCRLATGGGFATRSLYTDDDEAIFDAMRPVILNGITDFINRPDLLERAILLRHPSIPEDRRRTEGDLWARFTALRPRILGALLDRVAGMLRELNRVQLQRRPRMADFALVAVAAECGAKEPTRFLTAYGVVQAVAEEDLLEGDPVADVLLRWLPTVGTWKGSASDLLGAMAEAATETEQRSKGWPTSPRTLVERLKRIAPSLRRLGALYERGGYTGDDRRSKRVAHTLTWTNPSPISEGNDPPHAPHAPPSSPESTQPLILNEVTSRTLGGGWSAGAAGAAAGAAGDRASLPNTHRHTPPTQTLSSKELKNKPSSKAAGAAGAAGVPPHFFGVLGDPDRDGPYRERF